MFLYFSMPPIRSLCQGSHCNNWRIINELFENWPIISFMYFMTIHIYRDEVQKSGSSISPEIGLLLPPKSTGSWFLK